MKPPSKASPRALAQADGDPTQAILRHWREAVRIAADWLAALERDRIVTAIRSPKCGRQ